MGLSIVENFASRASSACIGVCTALNARYKNHGFASYRLTNVIRAEPDPSLFMVPADYTVKETGIRRMLEAAQRK